MADPTTKDRESGEQQQRVGSLVVALVGPKPKLCSWTRPAWECHRLGLVFPPRTRDEMFAENFRDNLLEYAREVENRKSAVARLGLLVLFLLWTYQLIGQTWKQTYTRRRLE